MLHLSVEDVDSWHQHIVKLPDDFSAFENDLPRLIGPPKDEPPPYDARVCYLVDPAGVLIHIAQFNT